MNSTNFIAVYLSGQGSKLADSCAEKIPFRDIPKVMAGACEVLAPIFAGDDLCKVPTYSEISSRPHCKTAHHTVISHRVGHEELYQECAKSIVRFFSENYAGNGEEGGSIAKIVFDELRDETIEKSKKINAMLPLINFPDLPVTDAKESDIYSSITVTVTTVQIDHPE